MATASGENPPTATDQGETPEVFGKCIDVELNDQIPTNQDGEEWIEVESRDAVVGQAITTTQGNVSAEKISPISMVVGTIVNNTSTTQDKNTDNVEDNTPTQNGDATGNAAGRQKQPKQMPIKWTNPHWEQTKKRRSRRTITTREQETFFAICRVLPEASSCQRHIDNMAMAKEPQEWVYSGMLSDLGQDRKLRTWLKPVTHRRIEWIDALLPLDPFGPKKIRFRFREICWEALNDKITREPQTRPISRPQLVAEVDGIYAGLVMVENKCIEVDNKANACKVELQPSSDNNPPEQGLSKLDTENARAQLLEYSPEMGSEKPHDEQALPISGEGHPVDQQVKQTAEKEPPATQEETIKGDNDNSMVPMAKDKAPTANETDRTSAANGESLPATAEAVSKTCKQVRFDSVQFHAAVATQPRQDSGDTQVLGPNNTQGQQANNTSNSSVRQYNHDQYQALIALHRTNIHEHHDFFLASQHPRASRELKLRATEYQMPTRVWNHGVHAFLEVLCHRLLDSLEHMLDFIYLAYSMFSLLWETVPEFKDAWAECLGDLSRYRMSIEDDTREREIWINVSKRWYQMVCDQDPCTGRLYHHLAILSRPDNMLQAYYYIKSLTVPIPYYSARESILVLFQLAVPRDNEKKQEWRGTKDEKNFITACAYLFLASQNEEFLEKKGYGSTPKTYLMEFDSAVRVIGAETCMAEAYEAGKPCADESSQGKGNNNSRYAIQPSDKLAIILCSLVVGLPGDQLRSPVWKAFFPHIRVDDEKRREENAQTSEDLEDDMPWRRFDKSLELLSAVNRRILERPHLREIGLYRYLHPMLSFMRYLTTRPELLERFSNEFHTELMVPILNRLLRKYQIGGRDWNRINCDRFPQKYTGGIPVECLMYRTRVGIPRYSSPFPEDWDMRGCPWASEAQPIPEEPLELSGKQIARNAALAKWDYDSYAIQKKKDAKARKEAHKREKRDRRKLNHKSGLREVLRENASALDHRIECLPVAWFAEDDSPNSANTAKDDPTDAAKDTTENATKGTPEAAFKNMTTDKHSRKHRRRARKNDSKDISVPEEMPKDGHNDDVLEKVEFPDFFLAEWHEKHEAEAEEYRQNLAKAKAEEKAVEEEKKKVDTNSLENDVEVPADWFEKPDRTYFPSGWFQNCGQDIDERWSQEKHIERLDTTREREIRLLWLANGLAERDAFFCKVYDDNGNRWHFEARGQQAVPKHNFFDGDDLPAETETDRGKGIFVNLEDMEPAKFGEKAASKEAPSVSQVAPQPDETGDEPQPAPQTTDDDERLPAAELAAQKAEAPENQPPTTDVDRSETGGELSTTDSEQPETAEGQSLATGELPSAEEMALPKTEGAGETADEDESDDNNEDTEESSEDGKDVGTENGSVIGDDEKPNEEGEEENVVKQDEKAGESARSTGSYTKLTLEALQQVKTEEKPYGTNQYKYLQTVLTEGSVAPRDEADEDWEYISHEDDGNDANTNRRPGSAIFQLFRGQQKRF